MIISDINHLEDVSQESSVVGGFTSPYEYFNEYLNVNKNFYSNVYTKGHLATAESDASAYGPGTATQIFTNTVTTTGSSYSSGTSISATDP